jgi:hypothetical protein
VSYIITKKTLASRLQKVVAIIARLEHTSFDKGKFILDIVNILWEGME